MNFKEKTYKIFFASKKRYNYINESQFSKERFIDKEEINDVLSKVHETKEQLKNDVNFLQYKEVDKLINEEIIA